MKLARSRRFSLSHRSLRATFPDVRLNGYRTMWLFVLFDLPVDTKAARRAYAQFRKALLKDGFTQLQYSVYGRVCSSADATEVHIKRVQNQLPPDGEVRLLWITDKQFERQRIFWGKTRKLPPKTPMQLEFF
jgi:CRISPR-associated protein Cas2